MIDTRRGDEQLPRQDDEFLATEATLVSILEVERQGSVKFAYQVGHRDARHAAAEIANEADAEIEGITRQRAESLDAFNVLDNAHTRLTVRLQSTREELAESKAQNAELLAALEAVEWSGGLPDYLRCPDCGSEKNDGHYDGCDLGIAIARAKS